MQNPQTKWSSLRSYGSRLYDYVLSLRDVRNVGMLVFVALAILVSYSGARAVQTNYTLQKQVYQLSQNNEVQELTNANLALTNDYYKTSQYLEVAARQNLGLAAPGETVLLVPKSVALAHTVAMPDDDKAKTPVEKKLPFWRENFETWMDFFLNRTAH